MKSYIKDKLREKLFESGIHQLDFQTNNMNAQISPEEREMIKKLTWKDISLEDVESNSNTKFKFRVHLPFKNNFEQDIAVAIDLKGGTLYQLDISLPDQMQGLGFTPKLMKNIIMDFGHIYSANARVHNPHVYKVLDKLRQDPEIQCVDGKSSMLCSSPSNPDKEKLFKIMKGL